MEQSHGHGHDQEHSHIQLTQQGLIEEDGSKQGDNIVERENIEEIKNDTDTDTTDSGDTDTNYGRI